MSKEQRPSEQYRESSILKNILRFVVFILATLYIVLAVDTLHIDSFLKHIFINLTGYVFLLIIPLYGLIISFESSLYSGIAFISWYLLVLITFFTFKDGFGTYQLFDVLWALTILGVPIFIIGIGFILIWWKPRTKWG